MRMEFRVRLDEIVPTKQAARALPKELGRLERGEVDQLVLTTRNTPRAVLLSVERFDQLIRSERELGSGHQLAA
jgi:PHD/YefM family antitoxin component YafN of YafNO toxin-antitoxin module